MKLCTFWNGFLSPISGTKTSLRVKQVHHNSWHVYHFAKHSFFWMFST